MLVEGKKRIEKTEIRRLFGIENNINIAGIVCERYMNNRSMWRSRTRVTDPKWLREWRRSE